MISDLPALADTARSLVADDRIFVLLLALVALGVLRSAREWALQDQELRLRQTREQARPAEQACPAEQARPADLGKPARGGVPGPMEPRLVGEVPSAAVQSAVDRALRAELRPGGSLSRGLARPPQPSPRSAL